MSTMMPPMLPLDPVPAPDELRQLREEIGLSQAELATELGFGPNGPDVVRAWEIGMRNGKPCAPTPLAWRCFRLIVVACRCINMGGVTMAVTYLRAHLSEGLQ